jgi:hypothetical protein
MIFETKVALVIRSDLASWQKMNFEIATTTVPLSKVEDAWSTEIRQSRTVFLV